MSLPASHEIPEREMPLAGALRDFFAPPVVTVQEMKDLSQDDRNELRLMLADLGYRISLPKGRA